MKREWTLLCLFVMVGAGCDVGQRSLNPAEADGGRNPRPAQAEFLIDEEPVSVTSFAQNSFACCSGSVFAFGLETTESERLSFSFPIFDWTPDQTGSVGCPWPTPTDPAAAQSGMNAFTLGNFVAGGSQCSGELSWGEEREVEVDGLTRRARAVSFHDFQIILADRGEGARTVLIRGTYDMLLSSI